MRTLTIYTVLFISVCCIYGTCSKDDAADPGSVDDGSTDNYVAPTLSPDATWITMTSGSLPSFYVGNNRPLMRKWVSTKTGTCLVGKNTVTDTDKNYLVFGFENTDLFTRFCTNKLNPGGKETVSIVIKKFNKTPGPGTYNIDIDYKDGFCWYDVYKASGDKLDSTRNPDFTGSTFNVTKMALVVSGGGVSTYKMTGTADLHLMYWKSGTSSTTDIQNLQITFNNVFTTVLD